MKSWIKPLIFLTIIVVIFVVVRLTGLSGYLSLESLLRSRDELTILVGSHYLFTVILFIAVYIAVTAFSIPGATILTLAGGFLFGTVMGAVYVNAGATIGASGAFLAARYFLGDFIQKKYSGKLALFNSEIRSNAASYLLTLRFIPVFPFFLINILAGMTTVRFITFLWTTSLGIIPGSLVYSYAGKNLAGIKSASGILTWPIISALLLLAAFSILPVILKKIFNKKKI